LAKVWVLDTETKGTGAQMVPIEKAHAGSPGAGRSAIVVSERAPPRPKAPAPRGPRKFKVVDVMTRRVMAEDASARETVDLLRGTRSIVDVTVFVWEAERAAWVELSLREKQMLWRLRDKHAPAAPTAPASAPKP
jgi:hypothetical protein